MKKWSSKLESTRKTEQDRPVGNFDFWLKVNAKVKVNWSKVKVNGYWSKLVSGFWVGSRVEQ